MESLTHLDLTNLGRLPLTPDERAAQHHHRQRQAKADGYAQLIELCRLGEVAMATHLAEQHPGWGYEIVDGTVMERLPPDATRVL
ncbi:hypothetical protein PN441_19455 [Spirulina major CS-329]|uniref:hypothetical protein n=1 Tax=Spirulina TaxID=1154 RepID=UPI00232BFF99|nr:MULTISPECIES: hypothetical protein [Spirulina]MDB9494427.1 hypothetical protein [Spirulina subsalsa CS-330]MDB9505261.1 hypothetical protein [Spirulina major CS-329]